MLRGLLIFHLWLRYRLKQLKQGMKRRQWPIPLSSFITKFKEVLARKVKYQQTPAYLTLTQIRKGICTLFGLCF